MKWPALIAIALCIVLEAHAAQDLKTEVIAYREVDQLYSVDAVVEAVKQTTVSAQVSGRIVAINVDVGDRVKQGEVIVRIDEREVADAYTGSQAQIAQAQAALRNAQSIYERTRELFSQKFVSQAALDKALADYKAAQAQLEAAVARVEFPALAKTVAGGVLEEYFIRQPETRYAQYAFKWDGEWQVTYETFRDMGIAYAVGLALIYLLVVAQFKSYLTPLIIMAPIPLTVIGVMPGHAALGVQFTATSMIGMIALAGIIVRNSILLVDFANQQAAAGMDFQEAIIRSGATRAKPIVLTGLAAMLGAFFILDDPIFSGLAVALIFGILVSTLLTLVVIPVLYYAVNWRRMS